MRRPRSLKVCIVLASLLPLVAACSSSNAGFPVAFDSGRSTSDAAGSPDSESLGDADARGGSTIDVYHDFRAGDRDGGISDPAAVEDSTSADAAGDPVTAEADSVPEPDVGYGSWPFARLDDVHLYLNFGDSVAAGYNASSGHGYSVLLFRNHSDWPAYAAHNLSAVFPGVQWNDQSDGGAQSDDTLERVQRRLWMIPEGRDGDDTIVTINVGGNDFNNDIWTMIRPTQAGARADDLYDNLDEIMDMLEERYQDTSRGRELVILVDTIQDPTDGTGRVPITYQDGFCEMLQNPLIIDALRSVILDNLAVFNEHIAAAAEEHGAILVDTHGVLLGHGLNAEPADQWIDSDCSHLNNRGHHEVRREMWYQLSGQRY